MIEFAWVWMAVLDADGAERWGLGFSWHVWD